ncbi:hypothetical protein ACIQM4_31370 [Streptomyces sp. NPDC091272]|uniref:hypothetical protein n=1 Tax=Streptomyces sp. NPDC091272 TaxID=3365981 RepID=UPI003804551A
MAWNEWEQLKTGTSGGAGGTGAHGGGAGGRADLVAHQDDLGAVGHEAYLLHCSLVRAADIAGTGANGSAACSSAQAATALRSHHFAMGPALSTTLSLWTSQLTALLQACARISDHLDHTKASHAMDDAKIRTKIHGVTAPEVPVSRLTEYFK